MKGNILQMTNEEKQMIQAVYDGNHSILDFYHKYGKTRGNLIIALYESEERRLRYERNYN